MLSRGCADNQLFSPVFFTFFWGVFVRSSGEEAGEALGDGKLHIISFQVFNFFFQVCE